MLCKRSDFVKCKTDHLPSPAWQATQTQKDAYSACVWACFQDTVLDFVPNSQKLQYKNNDTLYVNMNARSKSNNTLPVGSVWREMPIPDTNQITLGDEGQCLSDAINSFSNDDAKEKFLADFGSEENCDRGSIMHAPRNWHIMDKVKVPSNIEPGEYLVSWRWECYKADQLWSNCADVEIVAGGTQTTSTTAAPTPVPQPCSDHVGDHVDALPSARLPDWAGGYPMTCEMFEHLSTSIDFCNLPTIKKACCFCGGGSNSDYGSRRLRGILL
jgi:hypothetical protein